MMSYKRAWQNPIGLLYNITKTKNKKKTIQTISICCTLDAASS